MSLGGYALSLPVSARNAAGRARTEPAIAPEFVRLHVVAHSNVPQDQRLKAEVRAVTLELLGDRVSEAGDGAAASSVLVGLCPTIFEGVQQFLSSTGVAYGATVSLGQHDFPAKSYGGVIVPPGKYPTLRITLGEGRGDNWWCVLFPPLCLIDASSGLALARPRGPNGWHEDGQDLMIALEALTTTAPPRLRSWLFEWLAGERLSTTPTAARWLLQFPLPDKQR